MDIVEVCLFQIECPLFVVNLSTMFVAYSNRAIVTCKLIFPKRGQTSCTYIILITLVNLSSFKLIRCLIFLRLFFYLAMPYTHLISYLLSIVCLDSLSEHTWHCLHLNLYRLRHLISTHFLD